VVIGILLIIVLDVPAPIGNASAVSGTFQYYSNDASGSRVAVFKISNHSRLPIRREYYYELHVRSGSGWTNQPTVFLPKAGPVVRPNKSETFSIKAPAVGNRWRLCFPYEEHESWLRRTWRGLGLPVSQRPSYAGFTDEIDPSP
jgi:hypothetical protein